MSKRIKKVKKSPNPLFEQWLEQWKDEAAEKNPKSGPTMAYTKALATLRKCPIVLESGKHCLVLENFGKTICQRLDKKLEEYKKNGQVPNTHDLPSCSLNISQDANANEDCHDEPKIKKPRNVPQRPYIPKQGTGAYALLIALHENSLDDNNPKFMLKNDLINKAQAYCDVQMKSTATDHYSGWSAMSTLIKKQFVKRASNPSQYSLTDKGIALAYLLYDNKNKNDSNQSNTDHPENCAYSQSQQSNFSRNNSTADLNGYDNQPLSPVNSHNFAEFHNHDYHPSNFDKDDEEYNRFCRDNPEPALAVKKPESMLFTSAFNLEDIASCSNKADLQEFYSTENISKTNKLQFGTGLIKKTIDKADKVEQQTKFSLFPFNFKILLYVDNQETSGKWKQDYDETINELEGTGVEYEVKSLKVGDFMWIARCCSTGKELVLPYIVERKRLDDLNSSIKDGRYKEQKFRLKKSGIANVIYLLEDYKSFHDKEEIPRLYQAMMNTFIHNDYTIKFTKDKRDTIQYLSLMTKKLIEMYKSKELVCSEIANLQADNNNAEVENLMNFEEFKKFAEKTKNFKVKDMFIKQLVQLKGLSIDKAVAIVDVYPTPRSLMDSLEQLETESEKENLLANIQVNNQKLGPKLSKTLSFFFNRKNLT